jgi:transcriptional regulator with XRE-family HTH domain
MPHPPAGDSEDLRFAVLFLRAFGKLDRSELAAASGVSRNLIGAYEAGDKTPSWPTLERLAAAVGYPAALLEPMLSFIRLFRMAWEQGPWPLDKPVTIGPEPDLLFEGAIRAAGMLHLARLTRSHEDDPEETRRAARDAFSRLMTLPANLRRRALPVAKGLHTWAGVEILSAERDRAAAHDAEAARELGELALLAAERSAWG